MELSEVQRRARAIVENVETVIVGKREAVEFIVIGLLGGGHLLIEDIPGVGKTMLARSLARSLDCSFRRMQFTPDLLPADITGVSIFNQKTREFEFRRGPIFANIALADEINRATPKAQAALLECMEEFQVTVDGKTYQLPRPFFVIATENPIEYEGTYPLPEAQLDRFLMRVHIGYPTRDDEVRILREQRREHPVNQVQPVVDQEEIVALQRAVREVHLEECVEEYIVSIVGATRAHPDVVLGASPRGSLALMRCAQGLAALRGRDFVTPDDVKQVAKAALSHRIIARADLDVRGAGGTDVIEEALKSVTVPVVEGVSL
ncbi:MAG: AAA family ATPase [Armatimonadota bacterium]